MLFFNSLPIIAQQNVSDTEFTGKYLETSAISFGHLFIRGRNRICSSGKRSDIKVILS